MRAAVIDRYGPADELHVADISQPEPAAGRVRIRVRAAGINPIDWRIRSGSLRFLLPARFPLVLGYDVSGVVDAVGAGVHEIRVGDEVFCYLDNRHGGGYAEYATVSAQIAVRKPANVSHIEAAAVPLAGCTVLQSLLELGKMQSGMNVLINGASGGVGTLAVQIAKSFGARVTGVCSAKNAEFVASLGADTTIDYSQEDFTRRTERFDIVFDVMGNRSYWSCRRVLEPRGRYVTTLPSASNFVALAVTPFSSRRCAMVLARPNREHLETLRKEVESGRLRVPVDGTYGLEEAAAAHRQSEQHHVRGKLVLVID